MNRIHRIRRIGSVLAGLAGALVAFPAVPAFAAEALVPDGGGAGVRPRQLPSAHIVVAAGLPGWQIALIAAGAALLAAAVAIAMERARAGRRSVSTAAG